MKNIVRFLAVLSAATASWAACPAGATADQVIQSSPWSFTLMASDFNPPGSALIGTFRATGPGVLQVVETVNNFGVIMRRLQTSGRYIAYADCSGGEIMVMANGAAMQLEFVYADNFQEMLLVTDEYAPRYGGALVLTGNAKRTTLGCPAGLGDPLNIINNTNWSFKTFAPFFQPNSASVGSFAPVNVGGSGRLTGTETISTAVLNVARLAPISGRYIIYPDCSGGEIMIMNRPGQIRSLQLEFVFAGPSFGEMYMLNDSPGTIFESLQGYAKKF